MEIEDKALIINKSIISINLFLLDDMYYLYFIVVFAYKFHTLNVTTIMIWWSFFFSSSSFKVKSK